MKLKEFRELVNNLPKNLDEVDVVTYDSEHEWSRIEGILPLKLQPFPNKHEVDYESPSVIEVLNFNIYK